MGTPKALLPVSRTTFIRNMMQRFLEAGIERIVVTLPDGDAAQRIREELANLRGVVFCENYFPERELLGSVQSALGMDASLRWHDASLVLMPIDVPCPTSAFLKDFLEHREASIQIATHKGEFGHPILFTHQFFDEILQLESGDTLRTILNRHPDKIIPIESGDPNVIRNINTPADYDRFTNPSAKYFEAAAIEAPGVKVR